MPLGNAPGTYDKPMSQDGGDGTSNEGFPIFSGWSPYPAWPAGGEGPGPAASIWPNSAFFVRQKLSSVPPGGTGLGPAPNILKGGTGLPGVGPNVVIIPAPIPPGTGSTASGDAFKTLADMLQSMFGHGSAAGLPTPPSDTQLVPSTSSSGGSMVPLLMMVGGAGVIVYFGFIHKKKGAD